MDSSRTVNNENQQWRLRSEADAIIIISDSLLHTLKLHTQVCDASKANINTDNYNSYYCDLIKALESIDILNINNVFAMIFDSAGNTKEAVNLLLLSIWR